MLEQQHIYITLFLRSPGAEFQLASCLADTYRQARSCAFFKRKNVPVLQLSAGTLTLGLSTRLYSLFWMVATCCDGPLSQRLEDNCL